MSHLASSYVGFFARRDGFPAGGAVGDVLMLDASLNPEWGAGTPGPPGGAVAYWPPPFQSSGAGALDDTRGVTGDKIRDGDFLYEKETSSPDLWSIWAVGDLTP